MAGTEENNIAVFRLSGLSRFLHPFIFLSVLASCLTSGIQTLELFGTFWTLQRPGFSSSAFLLEPFLDFQNICSTWIKHYIGFHLYSVSQYISISKFCYVLDVSRRNVCPVRLAIFTLLRSTSIGTHWPR